VPLLLFLCGTVFDFIRCTMKAGNNMSGPCEWI
jgi:hypothetical protein